MIWINLFSLRWLVISIKKSVNMLLFLLIKENSVDFVEWHLIIIEFWQVKGLLLTTSKCTRRCFSEVWCKFDSKDSQLVGKMGKLGFYMGLKICGSLGVWSENCDMIWKSENLKVLYLRSCFFVPLCKIKTAISFLPNVFILRSWNGHLEEVLKKCWISVFHKHGNLYSSAIIKQNVLSSSVFLLH